MNIKPCLLGCAAGTHLIYFQTKFILQPVIAVPELGGKLATPRFYRLGT